MSDYLNVNAKGMSTSTLPKLLLYASPGMLVNKKARAWAVDHLPNLETKLLGKANHLMEEDLPSESGQAIREWHSKI